MAILALQLQDYTFGFAGINFLWQELNGFPRGVGLLFGPVIYFYLRTQTNQQCHPHTKHLLHLLPWLVFFLFDMSFFLQGPYAVQAYQQSSLSGTMDIIGTFVLWGSYGYYFTQSFLLYRQYRQWIVTALSETESVSLVWFRNFLVGMLVWVVCKEVIKVIDFFVDLDFYQDWWWNLALVVVATYVGTMGLMQRQTFALQYSPGASESSTTEDHEQWVPLASRAKEEMGKHQYFLHPELTLRELALHLRTTPTMLSAAINTVEGLNFNDFVNRYRVAYFKQICQQPGNTHFTLLTIAYQSGFNSKATFNRAFRKWEGISPSEYLKQTIH